MQNYLYEFVDEEWNDHCGERIFIQCSTEEEAIKILWKYSWEDKVHLLGKYTDEEAEEIGYDTY